MPTPLTKPVVRALLRDKLIVTVAPDGIYIREAGKRITYGPLSYGRLLVRMAEDHVQTAKRAKAQGSTRKVKVTRNLLSL